MLDEMRVQVSKSEVVRQLTNFNARVKSLAPPVTQTQTNMHTRAPNKLHFPYSKS